ncbi:hypothetical protein B0I35DRAFT_413215 [Stachybotrys elegans]|uniref:Peptidase S8/S53 domain-containing protein n=1 Tax=Stachybotrys elegans TaxID=80388 RepID=A0A8K0WMZ1_9HYPO|nr:hypothetical protein B0I35DRAFT_413215 [Stachybotrys elegans]
MMKAQKTLSETELTSPEQTSPNGDASHDEESCPKDALFQQLKAFLDWGDRVGVNRIPILSQAVKDYQTSLPWNSPSNDHSKHLSGSGTSTSALPALDQKEDDDQYNGSGKTPQDLPAYSIALALCQVDPTLAFTGFDNEMTPFHAVTDAGLIPLLEIMLSGLDNYEGDVTKHICVEYNERIALQMVTATNPPRLDVLKLLLSKFADMVDVESITSTIQKTSPKDEGKADATLEAFNMLAEAGGVFRPERTPHDDKPDCYNKFATYENAKLGIEIGDLWLWKLFDKDTRKIFMSRPGCDFLHVAVRNQRQDMVAYMLDEFPAHAGVKAPNYPLQNLPPKGRSKDDATFTSIRNDLIAAMIWNRDLSIQDIRKVLKDSQIDASQMCLHLATVDTSERSFSDYVQFLNSSETEQRSFFKFESVLKYAWFPNLRTPSSPNNALPLGNKRLEHAEIQVVYKWLKGLGVTKVMEVSVPDRLDTPHSDDVVAECVNGWDTRILKWKKLDLYLGNLYPGGSEDEDKLEELELYSSGNRSVHDQWYKQLERFKKLRKLSVWVVKDVMSDARAEQVKEELENGLALVKKRLEEQHSGRFAEQDHDPDNQPFTLDSCFWDSNLSYVVPTNLEDIAVKTAWPTLDAFTQAFKNHSLANGAPRTKVAIIDSGVVVYGGLSEINSSSSANPDKDLAHRIVDGVSLVSSGNSEEPFWHATEPHGTQMAKLISSINPLCELYVIKVTETRAAGVSANNVAAAVEWAREKEVDIISLSLVVHQDRDQNLAREIILAKDKDIVILSSTADGGMRNENTTTSADKPAHRDVITIAASDWNGNVLDKSQKTGYNYCIVGDNVPVGLVPFLKSREVVSGSSVATALAAGLASLIVACCRISANCNTEGDAKWRYRKVIDTMEAMSIGGMPPKWVDLDNFCGKGKQLGGQFQFELFVDSNFKLP